MEEENRNKKHITLIVLLLLFLSVTGLLFISKELPFSHDPLEDDSQTWSIHKGEDDQETEEGEDSVAVVDTPHHIDNTSPVSDKKEKLSFHVRDEKGNEWKAVNRVNIFSNEEYEGKAIIAPQSSGVYRFFITNEEEKAVYYSIRAREVNEAAIPMVYRLKYNGTYQSDWKSYRDISLDRIRLNPGKRDILELEWKWQNSERDSEIGKNADSIAYHLYLRLQAEEVAG